MTMNNIKWEAHLRNYSKNYPTKEEFVTIVNDRKK